MLTHTLCILKTKYTHTKLRNHHHHNIALIQQNLQTLTHNIVCTCKLNNCATLNLYNTTHTHTTHKIEHNKQTNNNKKQEVFIKGLAESKTFQRVAVHTDRHIQKYKQEGMEGINNHIDELHKHATRAAYSTTSSSNSANKGASSGLKVPQKPMKGIPGFFNALGKVIRRDLGMIDHKKK